MPISCQFFANFCPFLRFFDNFYYFSTFRCPFHTLFLLFFNTNAIFQQFFIIYVPFLENLWQIIPFFCVNTSQYVNGELSSLTLILNHSKVVHCMREKGERECNKTLKDTTFTFTYSFQFTSF